MARAGTTTNFYFGENHQRSPDLDMGFHNRPLAWVPVHVNELDLHPLLKESLRENTGNYARGGVLYT